MDPSFFFTVTKSFYGLKGPSFKGKIRAQLSISLKADGLMEYFRE